MSSQDLDRPTRLFDNRPSHNRRKPVKVNFFLIFSPLIFNCFSYYQFFYVLVIRLSVALRSTSRSTDAPCPAASSAKFRPAGLTKGSNRLYRSPLGLVSGNASASECASALVCELASASQSACAWPWPSESRRVRSAQLCPTMFPTYCPCLRTPG